MECSLGISEPCPGTATGVSGHFFLTLINALMASKCAINSKDNYPTDYAPSLNDQDEFDFIIVGGGSSGSVVANKLSENPKWKILLLEAGNYPSLTTEIPALLFSLQGTEEDWQYTTEPSEKSCLGMKDGRCHVPRGKVLGGCSAINGMIYVRGDKKDYDQWASEGNQGWDFDSIEKFFKLSENLQVEDLENGENFGRGGVVPLTQYHPKEPLKEAIFRGNARLGYPLSSQGAPLGWINSLMTIDKGVRASAAKSFLGKIKDRQNLKIALNSMVEKLIVDQTKTVRGVTVRVGTKVLSLKARKEVVVSAGAINSPQLLMLSGIGPKRHLENLGIEVIQDLEVGKNLQDHAAFVGFFVAISDSAVSTFNPLDGVYNYFMHQTGEFSGISITNLLGFINTKNDSLHPNLQFHHALSKKNDPYLLPTMLKIFNLNDAITASYLATNRQSSTLSIFPTLLRPKSRGRIELKSKDPLEKPKIFARYLTEIDDVDLMLEGIRYLEKLVETPEFREIDARIVELTIPGCESFEFRSDDYWKCSLRHVTANIYHPVGTCKMGERREDGTVVDSRLRVHGIEKLRVIDASIMPNIVSGNTNAACLMIGQKGAAMIMEDWENRHEEL